MLVMVWETLFTFAPLLDKYEMCATNKIVNLEKKWKYFNDITDPNLQMKCYKNRSIFIILCK